MKTGELVSLVESEVNVGVLLRSTTGPPKKYFLLFVILKVIDNICDLFEKRDHFVKTPQKHAVTVYITTHFSFFIIKL